MEHSRITLVTVELVFDKTNTSQLGDYENVLCIQGGDVMWQKERLIQIGIESMINEGQDVIAWLDADIIFDTTDWHENVLRALDNYDCVQSFDRLVSHYADGTIVRAAAALDPRSAAHGGSWAATIDFWRKVDLYQHCILGGADTVMSTIFAQFDEPDRSEFTWPDSNTIMQTISGAMRRHITSWAKRSWRAGRIGYVANQTAHLLAHGPRRHRYYSNRWRLLTDFDPLADVAVSESGAFRWSCDKPILRKRVRDYFYKRREDS
jgi:hypothetical protein